MPSADTRRNSRVSRNGVTPVTPVTPPGQGSAAPESTIVDPPYPPPYHRYYEERYTEAEARAETDEVKMDMEALWRKLRDLHDHKAWVVLGYTSWRHYCFVEFNISKSRAYQLINAAKIEEEMRKAQTEKAYGLSYATTPDPKFTFNEAQLRELGRDDYPQKAWDAAVKRFGGRPTAAQIKEVVDSRMPGALKPEKSEPPRVGSLTLSLGRFSMVANGVSTCRASASLVDDQGKPLRGQQVTFNARPDKVRISGVKDHGDGTYSATLIAGEEAGDLIIGARVETETRGGVRWSSHKNLSLTPRKHGVRVAVIFKQLEPDEIGTLTGREFEGLDDLRDALTRPASGRPGPFPVASLEGPPTGAGIGGGGGGVGV
jgi:hypothetical protein